MERDREPEPIEITDISKRTLGSICIRCLYQEEHPWHDNGVFNEGYEIQQPPKHESKNELIN